MARTRADVYDMSAEPLPEDELDRAFEAFNARFSRIEEQYLKLMGEHIRDIGRLTPSDIHRLEQIRRMNRNLSAIEHRIAAAAGDSPENVNRLMAETAKYDCRMAMNILGVKDIRRLRDNEALTRILEAQMRETGATFRNLANTTVVSSYYRDLVDEAVNAVATGTEDYGAAIRRTMREAGAAGLRIRENRDGSKTQVADYESGYSRRLDSAVRQSVLNGIRHNNQNMMNALGEQFGADGVEIDAHMMCAEDHLPYQGRQYDKAEFERIQKSLERPFGEWNCQHMWHPILLGISEPLYSRAKLEEMRAYSTKPIEIDGKTRTRYEWSQEMRRTETAVRQQKDTAILAKAAGDDALYAKCRAGVFRLNHYYDSICAVSGIKPEYGLTFVSGYKDRKKG